MKKRRKIILLSLILLLVCVSTIAVSYSSHRIAGKGDRPLEAANGTIGEKQRLLNAAEHNGTRIPFTFNDPGIDASLITDGYFDDDVPLLGSAKTFFNNVDEGFSEGAPSADLPGGNSLYSGSGHAYGSGPSMQPYGTNLRESLGILSYYLEGAGFGGILTALNTDTINVGEPDQGFYDGDSEGSAAKAPVPEPATLLLFGTGLVGFGTTWRKRIKK